MYQPDFPSVPFRLGLYPVVDSVEWIARLLEAGVRTLQLRIKDKRDEEVEADVVAAIALGRRYHARLFINDYWRLAVKHQAYGVHLGQEDLETTDLNAIRDSRSAAGRLHPRRYGDRRGAGGPPLLHRARARFPNANQTDAVRSTGFDAAGGPR